jgi:hypothetical protein
MPLFFNQAVSVLENKTHEEPHNLLDKHPRTSMVATPTLVFMLHQHREEFLIAGLNHRVELFLGERQELQVKVMLM